MALFPLKDDNPLTRIPFQYVTAVLVGVCVAVFLWQVSLAAEGETAILGLGAIPAVLFGSRELAPELVLVPAPLTLVTSMFLHGGWMHLIGNMVFLWIFGDNIEDSMGHLRFLVFYLACGVAAALAHAALNAGSIVPMVGASGAISGVMGAYLVLHPRTQVLVLFMYMVTRLPAFVVLGLWIGLQVVNAAMIGGAPGGGTAWWAHIGGFIAGAALIVPFRHKTVPLFDGGGLPGRRGRTAPSRRRRKRRSILPDSRKGPWD
ncbi:MAG: rhomboid family intramembrane serine protease [Rhodospirillales bacterium]|jgi:membrane associated rhomboid family serine protease|nr:rhomboid family intramembrane serine protease [Rhodospirillales bacterium]MDP6774629.1 rhomboid family intramembrane serine protease [Rhodospirillales bacterium]